MTLDAMLIEGVVMIKAVVQIVVVVGIGVSSF